jgi:NAD(P)-dependent dehydrogenase (short-subunit alcohol dehydrogenase family)
VVAQQGGAAIALACDVTRQADIDAAVDRAMSEWGQIDGLVNNAGALGAGHALELARETWDEVVSVNLSAAFFMSQAAGRAMARQGRGSIVNMTSVVSHTAEALEAAYCATKTGLLGLTRSLALDLTPLGIRCNAVSPGVVADTPMSDPDRSLDEVLGDWDRTPMRRMVTIDEVAQACIFLLSDAASGVTGTDLVVDGGLTANVYALESVSETGFASTQAQALVQVREKLASGKV